MSESRPTYDLPETHPWFEHTDFDWLLEAISVVLLVAGGLALIF